MVKEELEQLRQLQQQKTLQTEVQEQIYENFSEIKSSEQVLELNNITYNEIYKRGKTCFRN